MTQQQPRKLNRQIGFSIVELMIATTLGMVLTGAAIQFMIGSKQTYDLNDDLSRVQENGRIALDILAKDIRRAGYQEDFRGIKPTAVVDTCAHPTSGAAMPCVQEGAGNASDTLPIQYSTSASISSDCLGGLASSVVGGSASDVIANVYTVEDKDGDGINSLYCSGFNVTVGKEISAAQPLIDGVDRMQVLYRIKNGSNYDYKSYDRLSTTDRQNITAIRIGLLVSTGLTSGKSNAQTRDYQLLDSPATLNIANDTQIRRIYSTTIQLNNRHSGESV